jgi:hypothetical protein
LYTTGLRPVQKGLVSGSLNGGCRTPNLLPPLCFCRIVFNNVPGRTPVESNCGAGDVQLDKSNGGERICSTRYATVNIPLARLKMMVCKTHNAYTALFFRTECHVYDYPGNGGPR